MILSLEFPISNLDLSSTTHDNFDYLPISHIFPLNNEIHIHGYNFESSIKLGFSETVFKFTSHPICYDGIKFFSDNVYFRVNFIDKENPEYIFYLHRAIVDRYIDISFNKYERIYKYTAKLKGDICLDEPISISASRIYGDRRNINKEFSDFLNKIGYIPNYNIKKNNRYFIQIIKEDKYDPKRYIKDIYK